MGAPIRVLRTALLLALAAVYLAVAHLSTVAGTPSTLGALVAVVPYMATTLGMAWHSPRRRLLLALWLAAALALAAQWPRLESSFAWIYLLQHAGTFALLGLIFGRSLAAGQVPMVSRFARRVHGDLAPALARYTRGATLAWTAFFGLMTVTSLLLFFSGAMVAWSLLANVLTPFLVAGVFLAEYVARRLALPAELRTGLVDSVRAAWHSSQNAGLVRQQHGAEPKRP
jgi:uncharacterized membrane protein